MKRDLAMAFSRVTEGAALAGYKWLGRGDKNAADGAAVEAMRFLLNKTEIEGEIVIGEGEIDEAPCFTSVKRSVSVVMPSILPLTRLKEPA